MKIDNSQMDMSELLIFINHTFQINQSKSIQFIPKGEEGYCYLIETGTGDLYFVKALLIQTHLKQAFTITYRLYHEYNKNYILSPIETDDGKTSAQFGGYLISVFPFIHGGSLYERERTVKDAENIAFMMADFHSIDFTRFEKLPTEVFANPFECNILKLLETAEKDAPSNTVYQTQLTDLLLKEKSNLQDALMKMNKMKEFLRTLPLDLALSHGDPNYANIMDDLKGNLYLIDCGSMGIGPIERDLIAYSEDQFFRHFLSVYIEHRPHTNLHTEVFEFYLYRWCLQEISDYGMQIFFGTHGDTEQEHAWVELQPYLPIPHQSIKESLHKIEKDIIFTLKE